MEGWAASIDLAAPGLNNLSVPSFLLNDLDYCTWKRFLPLVWDLLQHQCQPIPNSYYLPLCVSKNTERSTTKSWDDTDVLQHHPLHHNTPFSILTSLQCCLPQALMGCSRLSS